MKIRILAFAIIFVFGLVRLKFEQRLTEEHRAEYFHQARLDLDMRQQIGQMGFIAALSGFRALIADILWIEAHSAWERTEWGRMKLLFDAVTSLQPRALLFWDMAAWHMAWNASVAAYEDPNQPREALRVKAQREYFKLGEDYLQRGIQNNPDKPLLYEKLGLLYESKFNDPCRAAEYYAKAAAFPNVLPYVKRMAAFQLAECPGHEKEAYDTLSALYRKGEEQHVPTMYRKLAELMEKLNIDEWPFGDSCDAAQKFAQAAEIPEASPAVKRAVALRLAECPGHEQDAYQELVALYQEGKGNQIPTLLTKLSKLQEKLSVPPERRIYIPPRQP